MQSEIEKYASQKMRRLHQAIRQHDRGVVLGATLAFIPVFPACTIGLIMSVLNCLLIRKGRLDRSEASFVKAGLVAGFLNSVIWVYVLFSLGAGISAAIDFIFDFFSANLSILGIDPLQRGGSTEWDV